MSKRLDLLAAAILAVGGFALSSSIPAFAEDQPAGAQTGQAAQNGAAQSGAAQSGAQQPGAGAQQPGAAADQSAAQSAADRTGISAQAGEMEVRQALSQTAQAVLSQDGAKMLAQQFAQADQDRLKDIDAQQLNQTVDQIRQAYKAKYQQDLDLSRNAEMVFNTGFFRIGSAEEGARQASARIGADSSSSSAAGAAGAAADKVGTAADKVGAASGQAGAAAGGSGTADKVGAAADKVGAAAGQTGAAAQTASSTTGQNLSVIIPSEQPASDKAAAGTQLNLVKEGASWKIQLPASVDGKQLTQRLQEHLQAAVQMKDQWPADANDAARALSRHVFMALGTESAAGASGATGAGSTTPDSSGAGAGSTK
jgi:hypothetical protein